MTDEWGEKHYGPAAGGAPATPEPHRRPGRWQCLIETCHSQAIASDPSQAFTDHYREAHGTEAAGRVMFTWGAL